ncbi:MAG: L,D-transpeptidase [Burkholderiales bacterium]
MRASPRRTGRWQGGIQYAARAGMLAALGLAGSVWAAHPVISADGAARPVISADAATLLRWVAASGNNAGAPFMIIDKRHARVWVFDARASLQDSAPALLGLAAGDDSVPGIGTRPVHSIQPSERTTPAGRFVVHGGHNTSGEDIVWIDYDAAVSMHRVRPTDPRERRLERLASPSARDNRITYGCINLPPAFYEQQVKPRFFSKPGIAYVLPETRPLREVFGLAPRHNPALARPSPSKSV